MRLLLPLAAALVLVGCGSSHPATEADAPPASVSAPIASGEEPSEDTSDLEALYWQRIEENRGGTPADVSFMQGMIGHHAQALIMAEMAARNGASPSVQRLASRIENAQRDEIRSMQTWLRDRGHAYPEVEIDGLTLTLTMTEAEGAGMDHGGMNHSSDSGMDHGGMGHSGMDHGAMAHDHSGMPGMLTDAQLREMDAARGVEFDRLFLAYMIQHHQGAVTMVDDLFAQDGAAQDDASFKLASDINVDQQTEIARMQRMLDAITD